MYKLMFLFILIFSFMVHADGKVTVNFNNKIFQVPRLTIDCLTVSSDTKPKVCQIVAFP